jgi:hypothetical protein
MAPRRVVVIVNKWWECDPIMYALLDPRAHLVDLPWPTRLNHPRERPTPSALPPLDPSPQPRAVFTLAKNIVEIWRISDLLEHLPDKPGLQSSTERKAERLPKILLGPPIPDLVLAIGTAACPLTDPMNGNVFVGTNVFVHDGHPAGTNPDSKWVEGPFDVMLNSSLSRSDFAILCEFDSSIVKIFALEPLQQAPSTLISAKYDYVTVTDVNVTDATEYNVKDKEAIAAYSACSDLACPAIDTTLGLIRCCAIDVPFMFVAAITNSLGHFSDQVLPRMYSQTFAAAQNAGVTLAWVLAKLDSLP